MHRQRDFDSKRRGMGGRNKQELVHSTYCGTLRGSKFRVGDFNVDCSTDLLGRGCNVNCCFGAHKPVVNAANP